MDNGDVEVDRSACTWMMEVDLLIHHHLNVDLLVGNSSVKMCSIDLNRRDSMFEIDEDLFIHR
mgnify:FL=1